MQFNITSIVEPGEKIDRIIFDPRKEHLEHSIHYGFYSCPECHGKTRFQRTDFLEKSKSKISSRDQDWFDLFLQTKKYEANPTDEFLDFYCPGCHSPVRIIYEAREFDMGSYYFTIKYIIDIKN